MCEEVCILKRDTFLLSSWIITIVNMCLSGMLMIVTMFLCIVDAVFWFLVLYELFALGLLGTALYYNIRGWQLNSKDHTFIAGFLYIGCCLVSGLSIINVLNIVFTFIGYGNLRRGYGYGV